MPRKRGTLRQNFERHVLRMPFGCWVWTGEILEHGYGRVSWGPHRYPAHRVAYELYVGPIPEGMQLDHLCRNRRCVNPAHVEPVTCRENLLRGNTRAAANAAKIVCTRCQKPYDFTRTCRDGYKRRVCRSCRNEVTRRFKQKETSDAA